MAVLLVNRITFMKQAASAERESYKKRIVPVTISKIQKEGDKSLIVSSQSLSCASAFS